MLALELILRWTHILAAIALAGGTIFRRFTLLPAVGELTPEARQQLAASMRSRWSRVVMICSALLLLSGLINFMLTVTRFDIVKDELPGRLYHMLFGVKFLLSLAIFMLAALLSGRTALADRLRQNETFWLNMNIVLAVAVVCLGGVLRAADKEPKTERTTTAAEIKTLQS